MTRTAAAITAAAALRKSLSAEIEARAKATKWDATDADHAAHLAAIAATNAAHNAEIATRKAG
jgi:hypothetical protein